MGMVFGKQKGGVGGSSLTVLTRSVREHQSRNVPSNHDQTGQEGTGQEAELETTNRVQLVKLLISCMFTVG